MTDERLLAIAILIVSPLCVVAIVYSQQRAARKMMDMMAGFMIVYEQIARCMLLMTQDRGSTKASPSSKSERQ